MDNDNVTQIKVYKNPGAWMQWLTNFGIVGLFAAGVATTNIYFYVALAAWLLYWNYNLFGLMRAYITLHNANAFNKLLEVMAVAENFEQKDGTISERDGLTKESESEGD